MTASAPARALRPRWRGRRQRDAPSTLKDHLRELRRRVGFAVLFLAVGAVFGFLWFGWRIGPIPSLGDLMVGPYCALPPSARLEITPGECRLLQTKPFEAFLIQLKVGAAAGAVLTAPLWLHQVWAFVAPGLRAGERALARLFVGFGSVLFAAGAVLAYFLVPEGLAVLVGFGGDSFVTALAGGEYISFVLTMLVIFGVGFELPLVVTLLNRAGVLPYARLSRWRRGLLFGLLVFAAVATPGSDPVSMIALGAAMAVLLEFAIQIARVHDKRRAVDDPLGDEEATPAA